MPAAALDPGLLLVLAVMLPATGAVAALALPGRWAGRIAFGLWPLGLAVAVAVAWTVWAAGAPLHYAVGGWAPPLGLMLRADGPSALMLLVAAIVIGAAGLYARADLRPEPGATESRAAVVFWTLLMALWSALNAVALGGDLFNLYVALELLTFSAIPLVCLGGSAKTLQAALRYLVFALVGSVLYLLGTALLYGAYGTLDIVLLSGRAGPEPAAILACALMIAGLAAKTALFPLHLWLPPAHAGAPPAASAVLSGLVVKASFFLIVRLWFDVMPGLSTAAAANLIGALGAGAILAGSVMALRQARLKLMIAYSTVAQIGYLFLMVPLLFGVPQAEIAANAAWSGGWLQLASHALAKAAMFLAAGLIAEAAGHDRIHGLDGVGRAVPVAVLAFTLAGLSLVGLPPSGGFAAKWLLLSAAVATGQWWWAVVMILGGLLAAFYLFPVIGRAYADGTAAFARPRDARSREFVVLALAVAAALLGLSQLYPPGLLRIGLGSGLAGAGVP
ncbi:complex I subunit 5 family protein [Blastochloris sulfoviridis]|uniref:NADH-quinone oxidoreductase subunit J n=1 Tax=Blastochloris sulfoviridis TaxID=50712 RepID=A0A5M6I474_9HYPH|nr:proton-conducting transporter membrane subunit [Blastochloris sulfoviridis]KAA5602588.1 NADH-quinone oxidoreductase subunit J [Blastochloris sulfoviridis]